MYNLLLSSILSLVVAGVVLIFGFPPIAAILPAVLVWPVSAFLIGRRVAAKLQEALAPLPGLLTQGKVDQARAVIEETMARFGRWQPLLTGQMRGQLGMLDFMQLKYDRALENLERGGWRDWMAPTAVGCIYGRRGELDAAEKAFEKAAAAGPKEPTVYMVWAAVLYRKGEAGKATAALAQGLGKLPDNSQLKELKGRIANKKRVDLHKLPESGQRFFPEEMAQQMVMRGRRGPHPMEGQMPVRVQQGPPAPKLRGKMARRR